MSKKEPSDSKNANLVASEANRIAKRANVIAFLAFSVSILFSIVMLYRDNQKDLREEKKERELRALAYRVNASQFRPYLKVIGTPILSLDSIVLHPPITSNEPEEEISFKVDVRLNVANTGNSIAHVLGGIATDYEAKDEILRPKLMSKDRSRSAFLPDSIKQYPNLPVPAQGDTISLGAKFEIKNVRDSIFTLHFIMFYENETKALFDTYYWARYKRNKTDIVYDKLLVNGKKGIRAKASKTTFMKSIQLDSTWSSTQPYDEDISVDITRFLKDK